MSANRALACVLVVLAGGLLSAGPVAAQEGPHMVTATLGIANPEALDSTLLIAVRGDLMELGPNLQVDGGLHFWKKGYSVASTYDPYGYSYGAGAVEWSYRDVALLSGVKYTLRVSDPALVPYGRAGVGLHFQSASVAGVSVGKTDVGIYLGGGADYRVGRSLLVGGELSYHLTDIDQLLVGAQVSYLLGS